MRAFVGLEIGGEVLNALVAMEEELVRTGADIKPVERENIHFTVKFLGEISEAESARIDKDLKRLDLKGGRVEVKGVGAFPALRHPSVIWAGVARDHEPQVVSLAQTVLDVLRPFREEDRRPYRPHATLGRVRSQRGIEALVDCLASNTERSFGTTELRWLKLKSSVLTPRGPVYSDLGAYPLA